MMMMLRQHETETKSGAGQRELARKGVKWLGMNQNQRLYCRQSVFKRPCFTGIFHASDTLDLL